MHLRILRVIATAGSLIALECTKFVFVRGFPGPVAGLMGDPTSKGKVKVGEGRGDGPP